MQLQMDEAWDLEAGDASEGKEQSNEEDDDILEISNFFEPQHAAADCSHDTLAHQLSPSRTDLEPKDKKVNVKLKPTIPQPALRRSLAAAGDPCRM